IFDSYFRGNAGSGDVPSAEIAYIATPHLGLVATVPFQIGFGRQTTGFEDAQLLVQWLAAGSLELDDMLSVGAMGTFPVGRDDLSTGDYFVGPFVYGAPRRPAHAGALRVSRLRAGRGQQHHVSWRDGRAASRDREQPGGDALHR